MPKHPPISDSNPEFQRRRSPSFLQRLGSLDLFNNLLFNRERVYQSLKRLSPVRYKDEASQNQAIENETHVIRSIEDEEEILKKEISITPYLKTTSMAATRSRRIPPKKASAKAAPKRGPSVATTKKRSLPARTKNGRAHKIQKTMPKANSGKRVDAGASIIDAYVISDSEDEHPKNGKTATDSLTPPRQPLKIDSLNSEDSLRLKAMPTPTPSNNLENELVRMKVAHAKEIEHLQQQLHASEAKMKETEGAAEQRALDLQRHHSIISDKQTADREEELEIERRRTSDLTWECDYLRKEMEAARSCLEGELNLIQQRDEYEQLYKEEQETNADLMRGFKEKDREATRKDEDVATEIQQLGKQAEDLQREVFDLRSENAALRMSAMGSPCPSADRRVSPTPSMSSSQLTSASDTDVRLVNSRKTYITVKKKYDNLHSVASNISIASRSMDYGSFGEFGMYLRQLKTALDENGPEEQVAAKIV